MPSSSTPNHVPDLEYNDIGMDVDDAAATEPDYPHALPDQDGVDLSLATRIIRHLTSDTAESSRAKAFAQGTSLIFSYICDLLHVDHSKINMKHKSAKRDLFNAILTSVSLPHHICTIACILTRNPRFNQPKTFKRFSYTSLRNPLAEPFLGRTSWRPFGPTWNAPNSQPGSVLCLVTGGRRRGVS